MNAKCKSVLVAASYSFVTFVFSVILSWTILASFNFFYGVWHDYGGIGEGIDIYGPQNKYKSGFGDTTADERERVFSEIVSAIHFGGNGLKNIRYRSSSSDGEQVLLHSNEIVHLQAVADIISFFYFPSVCVILIWVGMNTYILRSRQNIPNVKHQFTGMAVCLLSAVVLIFVLGPMNVFDWLHDVSFEPGHQWFFYYQDSLMSTLMLAPDLFGYIAVLWCALVVLIFVMVQVVLAKLFRDFNWKTQGHGLGGEGG